MASRGDDVSVYFTPQTGRPLAGARSSGGTLHRGGLPLPAIILLGFWFLLQVLDIGPLAAGGVAVLAHIGGFLSGAALIAAFRRRRPRDGLF